MVLVDKEDLKNLIQEVLDENTVGHCADEGNYCTFCYCDPYSEPHDNDCWLVRAAKLIGQKPPPHKGSDKEG
jgi:hypothetical protein